MVERSAARRIGCDDPVAILLRSTAKASKAAIRGGHHFAGERDRAAVVVATAGALAGKAAPRGERADQGHLAILVFFKAKQAGQRSAGGFRHVDAKGLSEIRRKRDDLQFFVGRPLAFASLRVRMTI